MEAAKVAKAETGTGNPARKAPVQGPLVCVIQADVAGQGVEATPAKAASVPEKVLDMRASSAWSNIIPDVETQLRPSGHGWCSGTI